jgi:hypothetical protein
MGKTSKKKIDKNILKPDRIDWLKNQAIIQQSYVDLIKELKRCPTSKEVSESTGLSICTIKNHVKELKFQPLENPLRVLTDDVIVAIYSSTRMGNSGSQKLWMQIMEGWKESSNVNLGGGVTIIHDDII